MENIEQENTKEVQQENLLGGKVITELERQYRETIERENK